MISLLNISLHRYMKATLFASRHFVSFTIILLVWDSGNRLGIMSTPKSLTHRILNHICSYIKQICRPSFMMSHLLMLNFIKQVSDQLWNFFKSP